MLSLLAISHACKITLQTQSSYLKQNVTQSQRNDKNSNKINKTPAKAFTPPAEKKNWHKVVFRQKSKRVTGLYLKAPNPRCFAMESAKICHFETFWIGNFALRTFCCFFLHYIDVKKFVL